MRVGLGGRRRGEMRGTSMGGGVLGFNVMGVLSPFEGLGGGGLGEDEVGL